MKNRIKVSVIALLSLGIFASVAPIVRLRYLLGMNDLSHFLEKLGAILAWAAAEANVGILLANLPACRPLLESLYSRLRLFTTRDSKSSAAAAAAVKTGSGAAGPTVGGGDGQPDVELGVSGRRVKRNNSAEIGVETRMYGGDMDIDSDDNHSMGDADSQKHMVRNPSPFASGKAVELEDIATELTIAA